MIVSGQEVAAWVYEPLGGQLNAGSAGIGWVNSEGILTNAFAIEGWGPHNAFVHHRHEGRMGRDFLYAVAHCFFNELGCKRVTGPVAGSNQRAARLTEHFGFELEAVMKGAAYDGSDLLLYVLWKDKCRMLNWGRR